MSQSERTENELRACSHAASRWRPLQKSKLVHTRRADCGVASPSQYIYSTTLTSKAQGGRKTVRARSRDAGCQTCPCGKPAGVKLQQCGNLDKTWKNYTRWLTSQATPMEVSQHPRTQKKSYTQLVTAERGEGERMNELVFPRDKLPNCLSNTCDKP